MASHRSLRRNRAAFFEVVRLLGLNATAFFGICRRLLRRTRFALQSHGLNQQFRLRLSFCVMSKGLRAIVYRLDLPC